MSDDLPTNYDVIVLGSGLTECIISAACARIGKTVLHLDKNCYYGGDWASFNFEGLEEWVRDQSNIEEAAGDLNTEWRSSFSDIELVWYLSENGAEESESNETLTPTNHIDIESLEIAGDNQEQSLNNAEVPGSNDSLNNVQGSASQSTSGDSQGASSDVQGPSDQEGNSKALQQPCSSDTTGSSDGFQSYSSQNTPDPSRDVECNSIPIENIVDGVVTQTESTSGQQEDTEAREEQGISRSIRQQVEEASSSSLDQQAEDVSGVQQLMEGTSSSIEQPVERDVGDSQREGEGASRSRQEENVSRIYTRNDIVSQSRRFNLDLAPKVLFSRGAMVELLISSNISRYLEFRSVDNVLTLLDGQLTPVPCSRADVFASRQVTVVEKRMLMKFLGFCLHHEEQPQAHAGWEERPFVEFLKHRKLTENLIHFILHSIAMAEIRTMTIDGIMKVKCFLHSLGRYGNTPFLHCMYGSGELPQAFCRLCAVFGGIQYLGRNAETLIMEDGKICGVRSRDLEIRCDKLVMHPGYAPKICQPQPGPNYCSRAVFITDRYLSSPTVNVLRIHPHGPVTQTVNVLEVGPATGVCPQGFVVVYFWCHQGNGRTAKEDLLPAVKLILHVPEDDEESRSERPRALWGMFYRQCDWNHISNQSQIGNLWLVPGDDGSLDPSASVDVAKDLFLSMFPGEEFLPRAPDPDEIVMDDVPSQQNHNSSNHDASDNSVIEDNSSTDNTDAIDIDTEPKSEEEKECTVANS